MISLILAAIALVAGAPPVVVRTPAPPVADKASLHWTREQTFKLVIDTLFERLARPRPPWPTFAALPDYPVVRFVKAVGERGGGGFLLPADKGRAYLSALFGPDAKTKMMIGRPDITIDGAFGRARIATSYEEGGRSECGNIYLDAIQDEKGGWTITQIVLVQKSYFERKCKAT